MLVVLTTDLFLIEWPREISPPAAGKAIVTDQGVKSVLRVMNDDVGDAGVPAWATIRRANLITPVDDELYRMLADLCVP